MRPSDHRGRLCWAEVTRKARRTRGHLTIVCYENKYGTVQELRSTFSHSKSINIVFCLVWFVS